MPVSTSHAIHVGAGFPQQHAAYPDYIQAVQRADEIGAQSIWCWDHFFPLFGDPQGTHFEGWTLLAAIAALTKRAEVGCLVTCNTYRNPALLSNMAKTVDHISNGRLILGMGAGWFERDYQEYGYEFGTPGSRLAALEKSLEIIKERWGKDVPPPVRNPIPLLIGGGGEKVTLRITAKHATLWHSFGDPEGFAAKNRILDDWCAKVGRNPQEIQRSTTVMGNSSPEMLDAYIKAGATHFIVGMRTPYTFEQLQQTLAWRDSRMASSGQE